MNNVKIYLHGRAEGEVFYPFENIETTDTYLKSFLDDTIGKDVEDALLTAIAGNVVFYTYIRRRNVFEKNRAEGYFAITVRCSKTFCVYVSQLYSLLQQVYENLCKGTFIDIKDGGQYFLVESFQEKEQESKKVIETINYQINKSLSCFFECFKHKESYDTRTSAWKRYSDKDVNSEQFFEDMKKYRMIISSNICSYQKRIEEKQREIDKISQNNKPTETTYFTSGSSQSSSKQTNEKKDNKNDQTPVALPNQLKKSDTEAYKQYQENETESVDVIISSNKHLFGKDKLSMSFILLLANVILLLLIIISAGILQHNSTNKIANQQFTKNQELDIVQLCTFVDYINNEKGEYHLDIANLNTNHLRKGSEYTLSVKDTTNSYKFVVSNNRAKIDNENELHAISEGVITIFCLKTEDNSIHTWRKIEIKV